VPGPMVGALGGRIREARLESSHLLATGTNRATGKGGRRMGRVPESTAGRLSGRIRERRLECSHLLALGSEQSSFVVDGHPHFHERQELVPFPARYPGTCSACAEPIHPGEQIRKAGTRRYAHVECNGEPREQTYKERYGRCEDAPCCGCCGIDLYGGGY